MISHIPAPRRAPAAHLFPIDAEDRTPGGPLFVARARQGAGRHDVPANYGAWYCSRQAVSAVAECIQYPRGHSLRDADFLRAAGTGKALVSLPLDDRIGLVDLDDPAQLTGRRLRPSQVATMRRLITQQIAGALFDEGAGGFSWWSTLDADWTNVTLFYERALPLVSIVAPPTPAHDPFTRSCAGSRATRNPHLNCRSLETAISVQVQSSRRRAH